LQGDLEGLDCAHAEILAGQGRGWG
jgi:hypothetical protein